MVGATALLLFIFLVLPHILTVLNFVNLFKPKQIIPRISYTLTLILGPLFTLVLMSVDSGVRAAGSLYYSGTSPSGGGIRYGVDFSPPALGVGAAELACIALGILGLLILVHAKKSMPPLRAAVCLCAVYAGALGCVSFVSWYLGEGIAASYDRHLDITSNSIMAFYMTLFPFNFILCSAGLVKDTVQYQLKTIESYTYDNPFLEDCKGVFRHGASWLFLPFLPGMILYGAQALAGMLWR